MHINEELKQGKSKSAANHSSEYFGTSNDIVQGKSFSPPAENGGIKIPSLGGSAAPPSHWNETKLPNLGGSASPVQKKETTSRQNNAPIQKQDDQSNLSPGQDLTVATGKILDKEGLLRVLYQQADAAILAEAKVMLSKGGDPADVAKWTVEARNAAKVQIRKLDLTVLKLLAEQRNANRYGNPIGPSYEQLKNGDPAHNIKPKSNQQIIEGAARSNAKVNKWAGRLRIAGRIMIAIDIGIAGYKIAEAPEVDRPKVFIKEASGLAGAAAGGWGGAKLGGMIGAGIGAWFGGAGAVPGAAIGGIIGGIGGAIGGGFLGRSAGGFVADQLYPVANTKIEGNFK